MKETRRWSGITQREQLAGTSFLEDSISKRVDFRRSERGTFTREPAEDGKKVVQIGKIGTRL